MNVVLYARVSTEDQTVEPQFLELRGIAAQRGWTVVRECTDVLSGGKAERPGLGAVMEMVREKTVQAVVVVKIDRLARSLVHFSALAAELVKAGVALIAPGQGIDTSDANPCGKFQLNILAAVAEFERDLIRERTRAGLAAAKVRGVKLGNVSKRMPDDAGRVAIVQAWRLTGRACGLDGLARSLGGVSRATAMRVDRKVPLD